jgi:hypothetical protein
VISIGNGKLAPFWEARWLNGSSSLYRQVRFKHRIIHQEMRQFNWIRNISCIDTKELLDEFILLFSTLNEVHLSEERDPIVWKWTATEEYMAALAYEVQFLGAFPRYRANTIWQAKMEP